MMIMNIRRAIVAALLALFLPSLAIAQTATYRGNYYFGVIYTVGSAAGLGSHGGATVARNGRVIATEYFPATGESYTTTARVNDNGRVGFPQRDIAGGGRIFISGKKRLGNGTFGTPFTGGSFFLIR
jgi:hypothetical protein